MKSEPKKILLITENDDLLEALRVILGKQYEIMQSESFGEMESKLNLVKCILVDLTIEEIFGVSAVKEIISNTNKPVIAVLDSDDIQLRREVMTIGIFDYVDVPLDRDRVLMTVKRGIDYGESVIIKQPKED